MICAALFDLDGTLVETEELKGLALSRAIQELHPEIAESEVLAAYADDLVGRSRREVAEAAVKRFGLEAAARKRASGEKEKPWQVLVRLRQGVYESLLGDSDLLLEKRYPHSIELLRRMRREGYPTACATMSHRRQVEHVLGVLGLEDAFDVLATGEEVRRGKPDPEIDLLAAKRLGVPPEKFLAVEDSASGVGAAVAAGMAVVAVPNRLTEKGLRASGLLERCWIVDDPRTLPDVARRRIDGSARESGEVR